MGLLVASDVSFDTSGEARQGAELIWTELGIGGLSLPWATD
jgi:hypothetical protein